MSTSKVFDKIAVFLIAAALVIALAFAYLWIPVDATDGVYEPGLNELMKITQTIDLSGESGDVTITAGGTYKLTGELDGGQVVVDVDSSERVVLILSGVSIRNDNDSAIVVENAGKCCIYLDEGSENCLSSGEECEISRGSNDTSASGGVLLLKDSATITGNGSLTVEGYINNGIHCSNSLYIQDGVTINVKAVNNGIKAVDGLYVNGGDITVAAGNAGLKSGASGNSDSGAIEINGGSILITQSNEGFEANQITINAGDIDITSSDDGINACGGSSSFGGGGFQNKQRDNDTTSSAFSDKSDRMSQPSEEKTSQGGFDPQGMTPPDGSTGSAIEMKGNAPQGGFDPQGMTPPDGSTGSSIEMDKEAPQGGFGPQNMTPPSGSESNEERTSDGGFSPQNMEQPQELPNENESESTSDSLPNLIINGGTIHINAGGDGLDSNGNLIMNGGTVYVDGPTNSGNGALDSGSESGGSLTVNGGTLLAIGASGMAETPDNSSSQNTIAYNASFESGSLITLTDADGKVLLSYTAEKTGSSIIISTPELAIGETYTLTVDDASYSIELTDTVTSGGSAAESNDNHQDHGMQGGFGSGMKDHSHKDFPGSEN